MTMYFNCFFLSTRRTAAINYFVGIKIYFNDNTGIWLNGGHVTVWLSIYKLTITIRCDVISGIYATAVTAKWNCL